MLPTRSEEVPVEGTSEQMDELVRILLCPWSPVTVFRLESEPDPPQTVLGDVEIAGFDGLEQVPNTETYRTILISWLGEDVFDPWSVDPYHDCIA